MYKAQQTILVVDDDAFFRSLVVGLLTPLGYRVLEARTVADAISALAQGPDLAIIDYRMPGVDGATFIKSLREQGYKLPIVFCSGSGIDQKTFASMRNVYQVDLIIKKPIQQDSFIQLIAELLPNLPDEQQIADEEQRLAIIEKNICADSALQETDDAIAELAALYLSELPDFLDQLRLEMIMAAAQKDANLLAIASNRAHQIRGTAGSLGFAELSKFGAQLECLINDLISEELTDNNEKWQSISLIVDQASSWTRNELEGGQQKKIYNSTELLQELTANISVDSTVNSVDIDSCNYFVAEEIATIIPSTVETVLQEATPSGRLTAPRVLIVEYSLENTTAITSVLEAENIIVRTLGGAMEAFSVMDDFQPDVVLLQMAMPGLSGMDMCRMIRCNSRWQKLPVIMLTETLTAVTRHNIFDAGASDFAITPVVQAELKLRVNTHLQSVMGYAATV